MPLEAQDSPTTRTTCRILILLLIVISVQATAPAHPRLIIRLKPSELVVGANHSVITRTLRLTAKTTAQRHFVSFLAQIYVCLQGMELLAKQADRLSASGVVA